MGKLALAGAISGVGKGIQSNVADQREKEASAEDRAHDLQLENQRMKNARELQKDDQTFRTDQAKVRSDFEAGQATSERAYLSGEAATGRDYQSSEAVLGREFESTENAADRRLKERISLMSVWQTQNGSAGTKARGWNVGTTVKTYADPNGGLPIEKTVYTAQREGSPGTWEQKGDKMILGGDETNLKVEADSTMRKKIEDDLMSNLGDKGREDEFIFAYGYLPVDYMEALTFSDNPDLKKFVEQNMSQSASGKKDVKPKQPGALNRAAGNVADATAIEVPPDRAAAPTAAPIVAPTATSPVQNAPGTNIKDASGGALAKALAGKVGGGIKDILTGGFDEETGAYMSAADRRARTEAQKRAGQ